MHVGGLRPEVAHDRQVVPEEARHHPLHLCHEREGEHDTLNKWRPMLKRTTMETSTYVNANYSPSFHCDVTFLIFFPKTVQKGQKI